MNGAAWGGSEELWYKTALYLASKGAHVGCAVYHWPEKENRLQQLKEAGCKIYLLPNRKKIKSSFFKNLPAKIRYNRKLKAVIDGLPVQDYKTFIINQGGFEVYTNQWKRFYKRLLNYVLLFHNYNEQQVFSSTQKQSLQQWTQQAKANLFAARRIHSTLEKQIGHEIKNAGVFINPITFNAPPHPTPYPSLDNGNWILSVFAALDVNRKAQDKLVSILSSPKWKERPWILNLYGEGRDKALLQKQIEAKGLQNKIFLKGYTDRVAEAIANSHLLLQLTNIDAMPLTVAEGMALSRPLVVTRVGDMALWVHDGKNGWVCDSDEASIETCLEKAWQHRKQWEEMGRQSFHIFQQQFPTAVEESFLQLVETGTTENRY